MLNFIFKLIVLISILKISSVNSNEHISQVNKLYQNQILDHEAYIDTLNNLEVDTKSKDFKNLLDLFLNNSISFETFDQGIINIYNKIKPTDKKYFIKKFSLDDCKGNSLICSEYKKVRNSESFLEEEIKIPINELSCKTIKNHLINYKNNSTYENDFSTRFVGDYIKFDGNNGFIYEAKFQIYLAQHGRNVLLSLFINGNLGNESENCRNFKFNKATFMFGGNVLAEMEINEV